MIRCMMAIVLSCMPALIVAQEKECYANYECDIGSRCVKQPNQRSGFCIKVGDSPKPGGTLTPNTDPSLKPQHCTIDLDCMPGYVCDRTYKVCVKRKLK